MSKYVRSCRGDKGPAHNPRTERECPGRTGGKERRKPLQDPKEGNPLYLGRSAEWGARTPNVVLHKGGVLVQKRMSTPL